MNGNQFYCLSLLFFSLKWSNEWQSWHKYGYTNGCIRAFLHPVMDNYVHEACASVPISTPIETYKTQSGVRTYSFIKKRSSRTLNVVMIYGCLYEYTCTTCSIIVYSCVK